MMKKLFYVLIGVCVLFAVAKARVIGSAVIYRGRRMERKCI